MIDAMVWQCLALALFLHLNRTCSLRKPVQQHWYSCQDGLLRLELLASWQVAVWATFPSGALPSPEVFWHAFHLYVADHAWVYERRSEPIAVECRAEWYLCNDGYRGQ